MGVQIRYMGGKHDLAPCVATIARGLPDGPCLDLFSGMCSVAGALAPTGRQAWSNDVQGYAALVASALLTSRNGPLSASDAIPRLLPTFKRNITALKRRFDRDLAAEVAALATEDYRAYACLSREWRHAGNDRAIADEVARERRRTKRSRPYRLATLHYAHGYFSLRQAVELDSLRCALDAPAAALEDEQRTWCLVALLQAASHVANAPGHFAEFLHVKDEKSYLRQRALRRRSVWEQFLLELERVGPYGTAAWRKANRVYCAEAVTLASSLSTSRKKPRLVYADPPYSKAQYSRYYHVLETLLLYDYPGARGAGRYRGDRFQTPFSKAGTVLEAFESLGLAAAELEADLILSYPSNGLLYEVEEDPQAVLRRTYRSVRKVFAGTKQHSTMGAARGRAHRGVTEMIFLATRPVT